MAQTATRKQRGGVTGKGFQPGQSGNPGGRPRSLKAIIETIAPETSEELVAFWRLVAFGTDKAIQKKFGSAPKFKDRISAAQSLADRLHGRAVQAIELGGPNGGAIPYRNLPDDELDARLRELERQVGASVH